MFARACAVRAPIGVRRVNTSGSSRRPGCSRPRARKPASVDCESSKRWRIAAPVSTPERSNFSQVAGTAEKVLDSCWKPAMAMRVMAILRAQS